MDQQIDTVAVFTEAGFPGIAEAFTYHNDNNRRIVVIPNIPLSHDHNLNEIKRKLHGRIGTPYALPRSIGKGMTEFQLGGLTPRNGTDELNVAGYLTVIAQYIDDFSIPELRSLQFIAQKSIPEKVS